MASSSASGSGSSSSSSSSPGSGSAFNPPLSKDYAESTFSVETSYSARPLLNSSSDKKSSSSSKNPSSKTQKLKKFLTVGEPPTAEYDRKKREEKLAKGEPVKDMKEELLQGGLGNGVLGAKGMYAGRI